MEICYYTDVTRVLLHVFGAHFPRPMPVGCGRAGRPPARGLPSITPRRVAAAPGRAYRARLGATEMVAYMQPSYLVRRDSKLREKTSFLLIAWRVFSLLTSIHVHPH